MNLNEAREYISRYQDSSSAPCPMTWDAAYELVDYDNGMCEEPMRFNGRPRWAS